MLLSLFLFVISFANLVQAAEPAPAAIAHWVGEDGTVETQRGGELKTDWTWVDNDKPNRKSPLDDPDPTVGPAAPALKLYLHTRNIPAAWNFTGARSDNAQLVTMQKAEGADPRLRRLIIHLHAAIATIDLSFHGDGKPRHLKLVITVPAHTALVQLHRSCKGFEVRPIIKTRPNAAQHLFLGLACTKDDSDFYFHFLRSADSVWVASPEAPKAILSEAELLLPIEQASKRVHERDPIFTVQTRDLNGQLSEHGLYCIPGTPHCKRWPQWRQPL